MSLRSMVVCVRCRAVSRQPGNRSVAPLATIRISETRVLRAPAPAGRHAERRRPAVRPPVVERIASMLTCRFVIARMAASLRCRRAIAEKQNRAADAPAAVTHGGSAHAVRL